jgi:TRAP-type C4-dicarboxylate transport system permease small subunit
MTQSTLERAAAPAVPSSEGAAPGWPAGLVGLLASLVRAGIVLALAAVLVLTVLQVLDRHFFRHGFAFDQYSRVGLVWLAFLGIAIGFREKANIRIDLLDHFLPERFVRPQQTILDIVVVAVTAMMLWVGWQLLEVGTFQVLMDTPLTYQVMYAALLTGLLLLCLFVVLRLVDRLTGGRFGLDDKASDDHDYL